MPDGPKVETVKEDPNKVKSKQDPPVTDKVEPVNNEVEPLKIAQPNKVDKLMDILGNNHYIIRRNDANELEMNGHAVLGSNFDDLYAAIFSPKGSQHIVGMTELLGALRQLNIESKDIVSDKIKAAYESAASEMDPRRNIEQTVPRQHPKAPKKKTKSVPKNKRRSTSPFEIEIKSPLEVKPATRSTTQFNMPKQGLSNVSENQKSGKGFKFPRILYVYCCVNQLLSTNDKIHVVNYYLRT